MQYEVLKTKDEVKWRSVLAIFSCADVYFLPDYHKVYEENGEGEGCAFVVWDKSHILFYPFLIRSILMVGDYFLSELWYDIETVYGYSGPLSNTTDLCFLHNAWAMFHKWCQENKVIAGFTRFHPVLQNQTLASSITRVQLDRDTVILDLRCSSLALWENYPSVQRNMVRKAIKNGLTCEEVDQYTHLNIFFHMYKQTMEHVGAASYYYFSKPFFENFCKYLGDHLKMFAVFREGKIIAISLFLTYEKYIHYHLAGVDMVFRELKPNNLLLHSVAEWGIQNGYHLVHLGGGRSPSENDSLLHFKTSISKLRVSFCTGRCIYNEKVYNELCELWLRQKKLEHPPYFLLYRL